MKDGKKVSEEVNNDKRPKEAVAKEIAIAPEEVSGELKLLMRTFKNLSLQQVGVLLIPFKAKQLLNHIMSELTEEQVGSAENLLKEFLFNNINSATLQEKLDLDFEKGGAGWNKVRALTFTHRVEMILAQVENLNKNSEEGLLALSDYLISEHHLKFNDEVLLRFRSFIKLRVENKIDRFGLLQRLDAAKALGGAGLYKGTADKVVREIELIMLLKYSA